MCRMLVIMESKPRLDKHLRSRLYDSLVKAARMDPYSVALFGEGEESHGDGWGFLSLRIGGRGAEGYMLYRSTRPIFEDDLPLGYQSGDGLGVEILHARAASTGMPVNIFSVHPVEAQSPEGHKLFLAHNGSMDKEGLARAVGAGVHEKSLYNDSYFLARFLAMRSEDIASGRALEEAVGYTRTAMNIALLLLSPRERLLVVGSYYKVGDKPVERRNYYKLYVGRGEGAIIYASSTIVDYYNPAPGLIDWAELPNGAFDVYSIKEGGVDYERRLYIGGGND